MDLNNKNKGCSSSDLTTAASVVDSGYSPLNHIPLSFRYPGPGPGFYLPKHSHKHTSSPLSAGGIPEVLVFQSLPPRTGTHVDVQYRRLHVQWFSTYFHWENTSRRQTQNLENLWTNWTRQPTVFRNLKISLSCFSFVTSLTRLQNKSLRRRSGIHTMITIIRRLLGRNTWTTISDPTSEQWQWRQMK